MMHTTGASRRASGHFNDFCVHYFNSGPVDDPAAPVWYMSYFVP
jgi:hypothetical protein